MKYILLVVCAIGAASCFMMDVPDYGPGYPWTIDSVVDAGCGDVCADSGVE